MKNGSPREDPAATPVPFGRESGDGVEDLVLHGSVDGVFIRFRLPMGLTRVGSSAESDLQLASPGVSREHAVLSVRTEGVIIEDCGSRNGTFVDGHRVQRATVAKGSALEFGDARLSIGSFEPADLELAIRIREQPRDRELHVAQECQPSTVTLSHLQEQDEATPLLAIERALQASARSDDRSLRPILEEIQQVTKAQGVAYVGWRNAAPLARAAVGSIGPVPDLNAILEGGERAAVGQSWALSFEIPVATSVAARRASGSESIEAVVLWGGACDAILLRCFGLLLNHLSRPFGEPERLSTHRGLRFPTAHVPSSAPKMLAVYDQLRALLGNDLPVLFTGESGVGKEVLVELLHSSSERRDGPLIAINCSAIPDEMLEAELFGVEKGAATVVSSRIGRFREAEGGTLFLDEFAEMPVHLQPKLLRALQEREVTPLGGRPTRFDARIVSATNIKIEQAIADGTLRSDLYYRLAGSTISVPALRERRLDIPALVEHFLLQSHRGDQARTLGVTFKALEFLTVYRWPGNVRQLAHEVRRLAMAASATGVIDASLLGADIRASASNDVLPSDQGHGLELAPRVARLEHDLINAALTQARGNQSEAARLLGVSRNGLAKKMKRLGLLPHGTN